MLYEERSAATKTKDENYTAICMRSAHSCRNEVRDLSSASLKHEKEDTRRSLRNLRAKTKLLSFQSHAKDAEDAEKR